MEATIKIDGKDVRFKSTAATPLLYRRQFNRDLLRDIRSLAEEINGPKDKGNGPKAAEADLSLRALTTFEHMAYVMAKQADPDAVPDTPEEWLDGFSIMPFYGIFPVLLDLWSGNVKGLEESKKKAELWIENLQQLSSSLERSDSASPSGTWSC